MLWTEKYRPKHAGSLQAGAHVKKFLEADSNQHLLLYGPPGTGKTTFAHLISKNTKVLELNASDERGINVVRNKIKTFAMGISARKTIILDECESLTPDAQQCLRRIIEDFSSTTRFIFTTNYLSKIIMPLKSRLFSIKFECNESNVEYLIDIGKKEGLNLDDLQYQMLFKDCNYDLRRSLNVLQGISPFADNISNISEFVGKIDADVASQFAKLGAMDVVGFVKMFLRNSLSFLEFLEQLVDDFEILKLDHRLLEDFSLAEYRAHCGCSTELLISDLCQRKIKYAA